MAQRPTPGRKGFKCRNSSIVIGRHGNELRDGHDGVALVFMIPGGIITLREKCYSLIRHVADARISASDR